MGMLALLAVAPPRIGCPKDVQSWCVWLTLLTAYCVEYAYSKQHIRIILKPMDISLAGCWFVILCSIAFGMTIPCQHPIDPAEELRIIPGHQHVPEHKNQHESTLSGWWFQTWLSFSIIYGMSSFPLTFIFFRGVGIPPTSYTFCNALWFPRTFYAHEGLWPPSRPGQTDDLHAVHGHVPH